MNTYKVKSEGRTRNLILVVRAETYADAQAIADAIADADGKPVPWEIEKNVTAAVTAPKN